MVRRLFWVCLPTLLSQVSLANDAAWNCQQDKNSKEWVCVGDKKPAVQTDAVQPLNDRPRVKNNSRTSVAPVTQPVPVRPVEVAPAQIVAPIQRIEAPNAVKIESPIAQPAINITPPAATKSVEEKPAIPVETVKEAVKAEPPASLKAVEPLSPAPVIAEPVIAEPAQIPQAEPKASKVVQDEIPPVVEKANIAEAKPANSSNDPGWHCGTGGEKQNWDCKLVGADPKGKPQVVKADDDFSWRLLNPVFDHQQENIFHNLSDRFPVDPWAGCSIEMSAPRPKSTDKKLREASPLDMNSNYSEIFDNQVGSYFGNVDFSRADQRASAHAAHYDTVSEILDLHGDVFYSEDEIAMYTDSATIKLATDEARLRDALFISPTTPLRGKAKAVYRDSQFLSRYRGAAYTSCKPGNQDWAVHASELKLNKQTGKGAAKNAWVEFKGFPVFYSPYLSFPMDDRRMTGFLAPVFGNTRSNGFDFSTPFYWNIAPNYDATLRPRYLMERGILLGGDFNYLTESSHGTFSGEFLPNDGKQAGNFNNTSTVAPADNTNPYYNKARYQFSLNNITRFSPKISSNLDISYVSDKNYFSDLGNSLSFSNFRYIKSFADLKYIDKGISLIAQVVNYQRVDELLTGRSIPYRKLPQINLALDHVFENMAVPVFTALDSEYVYFQHVDSVSPPGAETITPILPGPFPVVDPITVERPSIGLTSLPETQRLNIKPSVSLPWKTYSAYVTPKLSVQYTQYLLNNQGASNPSSVSRVLPILSVDSGLYLERDLDIAGTTLQHTIEPRLFYLYIPRTDQRDIPIFDSALYDFRFNTMFRENRFSGTDRVQDANQITLALTSRLIDPASGLERLKLNIGNILYFQDREVSLAYWDQNGISQEARPEKTAFKQQRFSNLIAEASSQLNEHFSVDTGLQWNPRTNNMERGNIGLHFVNQPGELINLAFQYRKDDSRCRPADNATATAPATLGCKDVNGNVIDGTTDAIRNDVILTDTSVRWPIYDDWYGIGRWQYSWLYNRTQEAFLGLEKENCCWRFRIIGRRYFNGLTNPSGSSTAALDPNQAQAQTGVFFQIELKGLTGIGQKLDDFFEKNIYGYQKPQK
ncbi:LPS assembly protein LptD [Crenothrix sp.]|uniref:LPS-assembly protein LptD n=1 Tax=Crenothrix sp. TaxID=3100433 RepID=UPI00374D7668